MAACKAEVADVPSVACKTVSEEDHERAGMTLGATPLNVIDLLDLISTTGYLDKIERGLRRHGISNACSCMSVVRKGTGSRSVVPTNRLSIREWSPPAGI